VKCGDLTPFGSGVLVVETSVDVDDFIRKRSKILEKILNKVPTGFKWNEKLKDSTIYQNMPVNEIIMREKRNSMKQLGTLGGGNHFIEFQRADDSEKLFMMIHC